jgi:hypothetical protein
MSAERIEKILKNTKTSMEVEGFTIDSDLEDVGRGILTGRLKLEDYIAQVKQEALRFAHEV